MKMLIKDIEKLKKARSVVNFLLEGIDPISNKLISKDSFLNNPKMIRTFSYLALVLSQDIREVEEKNIYASTRISENCIQQNRNIAQSYKSINDIIKFSKMENFNKNTKEKELKKLANLFGKEEKSV